MVKCQTRALFVKSGRGRAMRNWRERLNKRYIGLAGVILGGLLVIALLVWLVPHNPNVVRETGQKGKSNVKYVLVNNDNGATFNGRAYNLGKDFVTLIEQDTKRDWTTASADEADAGLANGSYDVVVMIPSDFSRRLLNLNSTNPTKAGIDYQVRKGQNEVTNQQISAQVTKLVTYFNNRIVRMYFASLIQNLRNAQLAMANQANVRSSEVASLTSGVQSPFSQLTDQYNSIFDTASSLGQSSQNDEATIKSFTDQIQDNLGNLGTALTQSQTSSADQFKTLTDQMASLTKSANAFQDQFNFGNYSTNEIQAALDANTSDDDTSTNLSPLINALDDDKQTLTNLSDSLVTAYGLSTDNTVSQNVKLIQTSFNNQSLESQLAQLIQTQVEDLPVYTEKPEGVSDTDWTDYTHAKAVLNTYNDVAGTTFGKRENATSTQEGNVAGRKYVVTLARPIDLKDDEESTIVFHSDDGVKVDIAAADLNSTDTTENAATIDNNAKTITFPKNNGIEAVTLTVTYSGQGEYNWTWNNKIENNGTVGITKDTSLDEAMDRDIKTTISAAKLVSQRYSGNSNLDSYQNEIDQIKENFNKANAKETSSISTESAEKLAQAFADIQSQLTKIDEVEKNTNYQSQDREGQKTYATEVNNILQWYLAAQEAVNNGTDTPAATTASTTTDDASTSATSLADQFQDLQDQIKQQGTDLGQNSSDQKNSLADTVKDLTRTTNQLKNTTNGIQSTLDNNVNDARRSARNNQAFANNFNQVMQNARNGENQNTQVYNFLSNPLTAAGQFSTARQTAILPYFMTVIGALAATVVGIAINRFLPGRRLTQATALVKHTRMWLNLPSVALTLLAGLVLGAALGGGTASLAGQADRVSWILYAALIMTTLTTLVMMIARYSWMAAVIVMGIVGGLFVMLSPFLGMLTRAGSLIRLLYQWSPLQNIQTGYSALYNGGLIGAATILGLIILILIATLGALVIRPLPTQMATNQPTAGGSDNEDNDE